MSRSFEQTTFILSHLIRHDICARALLQNRITLYYITTAQPRSTEPFAIRNPPILWLCLPLVLPLTPDCSSPCPFAYDYNL